MVDSVVRSVGKEWLGTCGIIAFYSRGTRVLHNEVAHVPYTGVSIGWGWTQTMEVTCESRRRYICFTSAAATVSAGTGLVLQTAAAIADVAGLKYAAE